MELIDIFDEHYNLIGTSTKSEAHQKGLWHQVFACLIINSRNNKVYLQYKNSSHNDLSNLNKIDISVGGHLLKGETKEDGLREIKEEANLDVSINDLIYFGMRTINKYINDNYIIREFDHLYLYDNKIDLNKLKSLDDEVLYFIEFDIDELISFVKNPTTIIGLTPSGYKEFTKEDFIKAYIEDDHLYLNYLLLAKQFINKEPLENISWSKIISK